MSDRPDNLVNLSKQKKGGERRSEDKINRSILEESAVKTIHPVIDEFGKKTPTWGYTLQGKNETLLILENKLYVARRDGDKLSAEFPQGRVIISPEPLELNRNYLVEMRRIIRLLHRGDYINIEDLREKIKIFPKVCILPYVFFTNQILYTNQVMMR